MTKTDLIVAFCVVVAVIIYEFRDWKAFKAQAKKDGFIK